MHDSHPNQFIRDLLERATHRDARIVDEHVYTTMLSLDDVRN
jgi:hypothetical protein